MSRQGDETEAPRNPKLHKQLTFATLEAEIENVERSARLAADTPREETVNSSTSLLHERNVWRQHEHPYSRAGEHRYSRIGGDSWPLHSQSSLSSSTFSWFTPVDSPKRDGRTRSSTTSARWISSVDSFDDWIPLERPEEGNCLHGLYRKWREGAWVIVPDGGLGTHRNLLALLLDAWDLFLVLLLLAVAVVLPYEIFCIPTPVMPAMMKVFNDFCDGAYFLDIFLQFFVAMPNHDAVLMKVSLWEKDPVRIAQRYCNVPFCGGRIHGFGWFWLDMTSVVPSLIFRHRGTFHAGMRLFLMLRLVRMLGLFRLKRLFERWQVVFGFSSQLMQFFEFILVTSLSCHWMACSWVAVEGNITAGNVISYHSKSGRTWLTSLIESKGDPCSPNAAENHLCVYAMALYFAVMTITTVGYGDMTPQNILEIRLVIIMFMVSGVIWAYVVGSTVSLLRGDPSRELFRQSIDSLNETSEHLSFTQELLYRLRSYMQQAKPVKRALAQRQLLEHQLSDCLRGEVALHSIGMVIQSYVYWAKGLEDGAIIDLAARMDCNLFAPRERIVTEVAISIIMAGLAAAGTHQRHRHGVQCIILARGNSWGHDRVLLESKFLIDNTAPLSLSYCEVLMLSKDHVRAVCANFPAADKKVRRAQIRLAVQRAIIRLSQEVKNMRASQQEKDQDLAKHEDHQVTDEVVAALKKLIKGTSFGYCRVGHVPGGKKATARHEINAAEERIAQKIVSSFAGIRKTIRDCRGDKEDPMTSATSFASAATRVQSQIYKPNDDLSAAPVMAPLGRATANCWANS